ncbi:hypothetical protein [Sphingomonas sp. MMS24-J13]|uniref:hypothetical protein n=1 Tax=Sphingomonas sp. MMS24-J13 TaxID=3238686 RepID=UPI00385000CE
MSPALHILQHALGVDEFGRGTQYRRHFVTGPGSEDFATCCALVEAGHMVRRDGGPLTGGDDLFLVTHEGRHWMAENSPAPPKLTRSQARYQRYLDADCGVSFREWLKYDREPARVRIPTCTDIDATEVPF